MALVPIRKASKQALKIRHTKEPRSKLPDIGKPPVLDYDAMARLCSIEGLASKDNPVSTPEAHRLFMKSYKQMFAPEPSRVRIPARHSSKKAIVDKCESQDNSIEAIADRTMDAEKAGAKTSSPGLEFTHNIKDYMKLVHKERQSKDPQQILSHNIKTLRRLLRKLPFERTAEEIEKITSILKTFDFFAENVSSNVLKELSVVAQLEVWNEQDFTVFGNTGLHMVLRGKVRPLADLHLCTRRAESDELQLRSPTPVMDDSDITLGVGDFFGTLQKLEGKTMTTRYLSVKTMEENCEFMKISVSDYTKVNVQMQQRDQTEKLNLLLSCAQYKQWPRQPLQQVASLIQWISYPPNTVIVSEGYKAPFIGFIKSGECHVLRQVEVNHKLRNGKKERRSKQVVMGKLGPSQTFAELSLLDAEPITCSIVSATDMQLGVVKLDRLHELDDVTVQLFRQSNTRTFGNLTKEDIQNEYIQQEQKREWNEFKHSVVVHVINSNGIRPGYGKWAK